MFFLGLLYVKKKEARPSKLVSRNSTKAYLRLEETGGLFCGFIKGEWNLKKLRNISRGY
jgi:hypothetical protein